MHLTSYYSGPLPQAVFEVDVLNTPRNPVPHCFGQQSMLNFVSRFSADQQLCSKKSEDWTSFSRYKVDGCSQWQNNSTMACFAAALVMVDVSSYHRFLCSKILQRSLFLCSAESSVQQLPCIPVHLSTATGVAIVGPTIRFGSNEPKLDRIRHPSRPESQIFQPLSTLLGSILTNLSNHYRRLKTRLLSTLFEGMKKDEVASEVGKEVDSKEEEIDHLFKLNHNNMETQTTTQEMEVILAPSSHVNIVNGNITRQ
ncbi:hypothetical protein EJ110_NYTH19668 [Nymphaea thermarum]|nr:hypothetical protein EJ110_NYTH19668 [Nymphaea thermarum]